MIGIQTVTFPHLVETIQKKDIHYAIRQVNKAKIYTFILSLIVIGIIVFISPFFMRLLLTGGKFNKENVETLISLFPYFILPAIGWGVDSLFSQPITAIGKQHLMTGVNIIAVVLAWGGATVANTYFGGLTAISTGLIVLIFTGIIGAEIIWRIERVKLLKSHT
jgi:O-antigen/teichoic acid export membrane protein